MMDQSKPLKEGFLQKSHPKEGLFSMTIWQKRYFVLWPTGTMEYYSGYNKRADEYCGTINLENCEDMVAPTSIGKRHNIIRLTVRLKDGKVKDFCLDCDYPQLLNEWVSSLAEASGLVADNDSPGEIIKQRSLSYTEPQASLPINKRPLPQPPAQPKFDYEIPQSHFTGDGRPLSVGSNYEEIHTMSPTLCQENDEEEEDLPAIQPRRYSRSKSLKRQADAAASMSNQNLLKRGAIPNHLSTSPNSQSFVPPAHSSSAVKPGPPPLSAKPKPPPKSQPNPFGLPGNPELQKRVQQRRQEMYGQIDAAQEAVVDDGPTEGYEEVQFTTEPTKNTAHKDWIENQEGYVDVEKPDSDGEAYLPVDPHNGRITPSSPRAPKPIDNFYPPPPPLPPRDKEQSPPPLPPSRVSPMMKRREAPQSEHESTKRHPRSRECSPVPLLPPPRMHESRRSVSPPPLPPHRIESAPILDTHELSPPPPHVPRRQSSQKQVHSSQRVDKPRKRILPYQTVDLNDTPSNSTAAPLEDNTDRQPVALPPPGSKHRAPIPPPTVTGKPPPPTKKKPMKPAATDMSFNTGQLSRQKAQLSSSMKEVHTNNSVASNPNLSHSCSSLHSPSKRPPAVIPRAKPKPPTPAAKPSKINPHVISGESSMTQSLPTSDIANRPPMAIPPSIKLTNGDAPRSRSTHKRPPLPPPKPKLS